MKAAKKAKVAAEEGTKVKENIEKANELLKNVKDYFKGGEKQRQFESVLKGISRECFSPETQGRADSKAVLNWTILSGSTALGD